MDALGITADWENNVKRHRLGLINAMYTFQNFNVMIVLAFVGVIINVACQFI